MKKFFAILLALAMTFALSATALADETTGGTITIANPQEGKTYEVYKIFDAEPVPESEPPTFTYTIQSDSPWFDTVKEYANMPESGTDANADGLTLTQAPGQPTTYVVSITDAFSAADFAQKLNEALKGVPEVPDDPNTTENEHQDAIEPTITGATPETTLPNENDPKYTTAALPFGYYFVTTGAGTVCSLDTNCPNVIIYDKNEAQPFDKTDDDQDGSVEVGQVITYTITGEVPPTTGYTTYMWKVTDTMSEGLTFNEDVKVTVGGTEVAITTEGDNPELTYANNGFVLNLELVAKNWTVGAEIKITYSATVNENAVDDNEETNSATLTYSNDPNDSTSTETTPPETEKAYTGGIVIDKYVGNPDDENDTSGAKLEGAKFVLYKEVTVEGEEGEESTTKKLYYKFTEGVPDDPDTEANEYVAPKTEWIEWDHVVGGTDDPTIVETTAEGVAQFQGLENGTYYVEEIESPDGYNLLTDPIEVTVNVGDDATSHIDIPLPVANYTGSELPATGGIGTTIFYIVGALLMVGAAVLLIVRKKMSVMD